MPIRLTSLCINLDNSQKKDMFYARFASSTKKRKRRKPSNQEIVRMPTSWSRCSATVVLFIPKVVVATRASITGRPASRQLTRHYCNCQTQQLMATQMHVSLSVVTSHCYKHFVQTTTWNKKKKRKKGTPVKLRESLVSQENDYSR